MNKHKCHDSSCEGLFHCPNCSGVFDLNKYDIVAVTLKDGRDEIVCEGCAKQLGVIK